MAARRDRHSRVVNTLKVLLPLAGLGLLSTLFFFSGEVDPSQSIPYVELNVEQLAEEQRVTAPYFAGVTQNGTAITLTGETAIPDLDREGAFRLEGMAARLETTEALVLDITSGTAEVDSTAGTARLGDGAVMETSDGMRITTPGLALVLASGDLETLGHIEAVTPFGQLTANHMAMKRPNPDAPHRIIFEGDVRMLYDEGRE